MSGIAMGAAAAGPTALQPIPITDIGDIDAFPSSVSAGVTFVGDGTLIPNGFSTTMGPSWLTTIADGAGEAFSIRVTVTAGTNPSSGTVGSWLTVGASQAWTWTRSAIGTTSATIDIELSRDGGSTVAASVTAVPVNIEVLP